VEAEQKGQGEGDFRTHRAAKFILTSTHPTLNKGISSYPMSADKVISDCLGGLIKSCVILRTVILKLTQL
jgi:hypothetical protein